MAPSTIHAIYNRGWADLENVAKLARAANTNPKHVLVLMGAIDEELSDEDEHLVKVREALAALPAELRPLASDLAVALIERLQGQSGQLASQSYLRAIDDQGDRGSA